MWAWVITGVSSNPAAIIAAATLGDLFQYVRHLSEWGVLVFIDAWLGCGNMT